MTETQIKELINKYPFLRIRNVWTGKEYPDSDTYRGETDLPQGWSRLFLIYCRNIYPFLKINNMLESFMFSDIKEKYGTMRLYNLGIPAETGYLTEMFESFSRYVCMRCGKLTRFQTRGWIESLCRNCLKKETTERHHVTKLPLRMNFRATVYKDGKREKICISLKMIKKEYLMCMKMSEQEFFDYIVGV